MVAAKDASGSSMPPGDLRVARRAQQMRLRSHAGGAILLHRSIDRYELPTMRLVAGIALALAFTAGLLALRDPLGQIWAQVLAGWLHALDLPGRSDAVVRSGNDGWLDIAVPSIDLQPAQQHERTLAAHAGVAAAVWWLAGRLPDAGRPATYMLRFGVLVHAASVGYFALRGASFPHSLAGHVEGGLRHSWALMLIVPWIHLAAYYLFPFSLWQRAALTVVTLLWLAALAPVQYTLHAALLQQFGLVLMPLLNMLFGMLVPIFGVVALYGWAMSWPDRSDAGRRPAPAPGAAVETTGGGPS